MELGWKMSGDFKSYEFICGMRIGKFTGAEGEHWKFLFVDVSIRGLEYIFDYGNFVMAI